MALAFYHMGKRYHLVLKLKIYEHHNDPIGTASANSVESDLGCTSRIYFVSLTYIRGLIFELSRSLPIAE